MQIVLMAIKENWEIMKHFSKKIFLLLAVIFYSSQASAQMVTYDPAAVAQLIKGYAQQVQQYAQMVFQTAEEARLHIEADATVMMTGLKSDIANKGIQEDIAQYHESEENRRETIRLAHALVQPATTCVALGAADSGPKVDASIKAAVFSKSSSHIVATHSLPALEPAGTTYLVTPLHANTNEVQQVVQAYNYSMSNFCTQAEVDANRCGGYTKAAGKYPGGDISPQYLFTDINGNDTMKSDQHMAVDAFINHIVDSIPPEVLRNPQWESTPDGRKYVLMVREYASYMNLAKYSLNTIELSHMPIAGLGDAMGLTNDPRFADRHDISKMEAADLYIKTKWSPEAIKDLATATEPTTILRDIAMMNAYRMWIEYQNLTASDRQEAILAAQLALLTRQTYSSNLAQQKQAAIGRGNSSGSQ